MNANVGRLITPLKIDISTGDVITPRAIEFNYDLLLEDRSISLWSYNLETILAEKLQTVLARGILNTRMRDFYDIRMLLDTYEDKVNKAVLKDAFAATCKKRGTDNLQEQAEEIIKIIEADEQLQVLWRAYRKKYSYSGRKPKNECGKECYSCPWESDLYLCFAEERSEGYCNHAVCCGASHVL
jgi:predicted amino acid-binding ACT domain protein